MLSMPRLPWSPSKKWYSRWYSFLTVRRDTLATASGPKCRAASTSVSCGSGRGAASRGGVYGSCMTGGD
jgi:hypothetical protein